MLNLTAQNRKIQLFLEENGIKAIPKYLEKGSQKGCIRIWTKYETWNGNEELQKNTKILDLKILTAFTPPIPPKYKLIYPIVKNTKCIFIEYFGWINYVL